MSIKYILQESTCALVTSLRANPLARSPGQVTNMKEFVNKILFLLLNLAFRQVGEKIKVKTDIQCTISDLFDSTGRKLISLCLALKYKLYRNFYFIRSFS